MKPHSSPPPRRHRGAVPPVAAGPAAAAAAAAAPSPLPLTPPPAAGATTPTEIEDAPTEIDESSPVSWATAALPSPEQKVPLLSLRDRQSWRFVDCLVADEGYRRRLGVTGIDRPTTAARRDRSRSRGRPAAAGQPALAAAQPAPAPSAQPSPRPASLIPPSSPAPSASASSSSGSPAVITFDYAMTLNNYYGPGSNDRIECNIYNGAPYDSSHHNNFSRIR